MSDEQKTRRPGLRRAAFRVFLVLLCFGIWFALISPKSPLSMAWNPLTPLSLQDGLTPLTAWKLRSALEDTESCVAALETGADFKELPDYEKSPICHIRGQVELSGVGGSNLAPLNTRCQTALRVAMWERHGIQPAAERLFGQPVREILHLSSYSCRQIRTTQGGETQMSTHATADAIDVTGFVLEDGQRITLLKNWKNPERESDFLLEVWDGACEWFRVTLSPDYNALHADHFHLQHTGWGLCR